MPKVILRNLDQLLLYDSSEDCGEFVDQACDLCPTAYKFAAVILDACGEPPELCGILLTEETQRHVGHIDEEASDKEHEHNDPGRANPHLYKDSPTAEGQDVEKDDNEVRGLVGKPQVDEYVVQMGSVGFDGGLPMEYAT